jgi:biuret amidohydrolase
MTIVHRGFEIGRTLPDLCRPDRMALVVYDMQVGIVAQLADGPAVVARVAGVLDAARRGGFRIVFMRHLSMPRELMGAFQYRQAMAWQRTDDPEAVRPWFLRGTPGVEIVPELAPRDSEAVLDKITFSAFEGTPLAMVLRDCGLTAFAICGLATEIGIDPTVRHGADLGLVPIVIADACGAGHAEAGARAMANITFMGDALVTGSADLVRLMTSPTHTEPR